MIVEQGQEAETGVMNVIMLVDRFGFPYGNAATARVGLIARALVEQGVSVSVLLARPSDYPNQVINRQIAGKHKGVDFEYTSGKTVRDSSFLVRRYRTFRGWLLAIRRILTARARSCLYLYSDNPVLCIPAILAARIRGMPVVIELCEWRPSRRSCPASVKWYYKNLRFALADGVLAISAHLRDRVKLIRNTSSRPKIIEVPILTDLAEAHRSSHRCSNGERYVLWCGQLDGYIDSVLWLIKVFSHVSSRHECKFLAVGRCTPELEAHIRSFADSLGINGDRIVLTGYVPREQLFELYQNAQALLAPLEDDERSKARFPTKIGEYLASGRPVITNSVGEINRFLRDGETAFIAAPQNEEAFAGKIEQVLSDPELSRKIGLAGRQVAVRYFDYSKHGKRISEFLNTFFLPR